MVKKLNYTKDNGIQYKYFIRDFSLYYGIGLNSSNIISKLFGLPNKHNYISSFSEQDIIQIEYFIRKNYSIDTKLKLEVIENIKSFIELKIFRGFRHKQKLPVNGQRSKQNAKTIARLKPLTIDSKYSKDIFRLLEKYN